MSSPLTRVDSYQYPSAHLGHLNESQQSNLEDFKKISKERGYFRPVGENGSTKASHDDETLLRYLRARKFNPEEGFGQFKETEDWRKDNQVDEYYEKIDINEYEAARRLYPQWTGRRDRRGIPVYLFTVAPLTSKMIQSYESSLTPDKCPPLNPSSKTLPPPKLMRLIALYENLTGFVSPLCSAVTSSHRPHPETPVSQSNNIVDISGVGLRQFWFLKSHMQDASTLATARYPETLDRIFIIGAPSFFPTVWSWIKRWFDPVTVSKIFILSQAEVLPTLEKYIPIENIPKIYGGKLDFKWGDLPILEPAITDALEWIDDSPATASETKNLVQSAPSVEAKAPEKGEILPEKQQHKVPIGPLKWRPSASDPSRLELVLVGTENGKPRDKVIARTKPSVDIKVMNGFAALTIDGKNEPVKWSKEEEEMATLDAKQTQEDVERREEELEKEGVDLDKVEEVEEAKP